MSHAARDDFANVFFKRSLYETGESMPPFFVTVGTIGTHWLLYIVCLRK